MSTISDARCRVSALIELVGTDTRKLLDKLYADVGAQPALRATDDLRASLRGDHSDRSRRLVRIAEAGNCVLTLRPALGEFVPAGAPLFEIAGAAERVDVNAATTLRRAWPRAHS